LVERIVENEAWQGSRGIYVAEPLENMLRFWHCSKAFFTVFLRSMPYRNLSRANSIKIPEASKCILFFKALISDLLASGVREPYGVRLTVSKSSYFSRVVHFHQDELQCNFVELMNMLKSEQLTQRPRNPDVVKAMTALKIQNGWESAPRLITNRQTWPSHLACYELELLRNMPIYWLARTNHINLKMW
jgi:hypothetical protein